MYDKEKQSKEPQDPLFSQPYVPTETDPTKTKSKPDTTTVPSLSLIKKRPDSHPRNKRQEKTLPALFMRPPVNKPKQSK